MMRRRRLFDRREAQDARKRLGGRVLAVAGVLLVVLVASPTIPWLAGGVFPVLPVQGASVGGEVAAAKPVVERRETAALVLDGETLMVDGRQVRLAGISAPKRHEPCRDSSGSGFDCGAASATHLAALIGGASVRCMPTGADRVGSVCLARGAELNAGLVLAGYARAVDPVYRRGEAEAREARRGLWAAGAEPPRQWRERR